MITNLVGEHLVLVELLGALAVLVLDHGGIIGEAMIDEGIAAELTRGGIENLDTANTAKLEEGLLQGKQARNKVARLVAVGVGGAAGKEKSERNELADVMVVMLHDQTDRCILLS